MFYDYFETGLIGTLTLAADEVGLRHVYFPKGRHTRLVADAWLHRPEFFAQIKRQLRSYFKGELRTFDLPLAPPDGTDFQRTVWDALTRIPYGQVVSYKSIAEEIGNPRAVRAVGGANAKNPIPVIIPCHRVIGSSGSLTGFGGGLETKSRLIDLEKCHSETRETR
jgi:methylated-DNA-[protein]-cysteine S-methyltransferase